MTDEEKKEFEELKSLLYQGTLTQYGKRKLIDMFEKQSNEIEELKNDLNKKPIFLIKDLYNRKLKEISLQDAEGLIEQGREEMIDKIKAKIEEVEQWELYNMKIPKLSTLDERLGAKIGIKYILESLLEKE